MRSRLLGHYPEDVRKKKLAAKCMAIAQTGQYNLLRMAKREDWVTVRTVIAKFTDSVMGAAVLLNRRYKPYYKWAFRALRDLPLLAGQADALERLLTTDNAPARADEQQDAIETVAAAVIDALCEQDLTRAVCGDLEKHAYSVNDRVEDAALRNEHILAAI